jgi:UV DNA damage endonuclease
MPPKRKRAITITAATNPDVNAEIIDGKDALRASPDADEDGEALNVAKVIGRKATNGKRAVKMEGDEGDSEFSYPPIDPPSNKKVKRTPTKASVAAKKGSDEIKAFKAEQAAKKSVVKMEDGEDVEPDVLEDLDAERREARRAPPVNSDYLPLPWKGRLGYVSLITT